MKDVPYESKKFKYTAIEERVYNPDGVITDDILIEVKGRFRTRAEARKYLHFRNCYPNVHLCFVLGGKDVPLPGAKERKKDGRKRTHEDWLTENGFLYCYEDTVEQFLREVVPTLMSPEDSIPSIKEEVWKVTTRKKKK